MCACEPGFTCARCAERDRDDDAERERFEEMIHAGEWPERAVPALADLEASDA